MIKLDAALCSDFESASSREWLETDGTGSYASSSISGANTRRYHGLLVAATRPPLGRMVLLSKFEETLYIDDAPFDVSCNQYPGAVYPEGSKYLVQFRLDPFPVWTYDINGVEIEKSIFMAHGAVSTVCRWDVKNRSEHDDRHFALELKPLLAFRDHHHLRREDERFCRDFAIGEGVVSITPYPDMPTLYLGHNGTVVEKTGYWYLDLEYRIEQERGFDYREDLFQPFSLRFDLARGASVTASTVNEAINVDVFEKREVKRRGKLIGLPGDDATNQLVLAADQFIVARGEGKTVIAGYHWFSDWGRDTMIALPGLTLATNRTDIAKSILAEFSKHISEGMLPNRFPDAGEVPDYNTVDATLWYFEAVRAYTEATDDYDFVRQMLWQKLVNIIDWHIHGTRYQIKVDTDGLLYAGEPGVQLTWMDAKVGDWVVTPRTGKAVEIQALWYNALCIMNDLATRFGDDTLQPRYFEMAEIARDSFNGQFWNDEVRCLFDVIDGEEKDASVRPNQVFAVSLPHTMLDSDRARAVVDKVESRLLTPVGLRSLSPDDPRYSPVYIGSPMTRDGSYHQGTVWGWLIGPFVEAYRRVHARDEDVETRVSEILSGLKTHLTETMVGQISEIFDGDAPHKPRGAAAQAWSVAALLRSVGPVK